MSSHLIRGRQLSRDTEHRLALRRNLCQSLFEHGKVKTTLPKAKEVKAMAEKLITLARQNTLNSRRKVISLMRDRRLVDAEQEFTGKTVVQKLFDEVAPRFADRPGGYTRILRLAKPRLGDAGIRAILEFVGVRDRVVEKSVRPTFEGETPSAPEVGKKPKKKPAAAGKA